MPARWVVLAVLILAPLLFVAIPLVRGEALGDFDGVRQSSPWNAAPSRPFDVLQADAALQFFPWRDLVFEAWRRGEAPLWNPYALGGTPLLANSQSGALYPPHVAMAFFPVSTATRMTLLVWLHLALAGLGVYALARRLGADRFGAGVGGLAFGLSAFLTAWAALPSVISTCAWIPWCLWAAIGCVPQRGAGSAWRGCAALTPCVSMMLLAGHLQFAAYGLMATALILVWMAVARRSGLGALAGLVGLILGAGLAAPQLGPVMAYAKFSHRQSLPTEQGYAAYVAGAVQPFEIPGLLVPQFAGDPRRWAGEALAPLSGYWPAVVKRGANYAESAVGLGAVTLLALAFLRRTAFAHPGAWGLGAVGLWALLLALGTPLNRLLYFAVPGWSSSGSPARVGVIFVLAGAVLAALALGRLGEVDRPSARPLVWAAVFAVGALILGLAVSAPSPWIQGVSPEVVSTLRRSAALAALAALVAALGWVALLTWPKSRDQRTLLLALVALLLLASVGVPRSGASLAQVEGPADGRRIAVQNDSWELLVAVPAALPPNTATASRIHEIGGYDSLLHRDTVRLLAEANRGDPAPLANGNMMFVKSGADRARLAEMGVSELWVRQDGATPEQRTFGRMVARGLIAVPIEGPGRVSTETRPARIVRETLRTIDIEAEGPGTLTLRDRNLPGWSTWIGDRFVHLPPGPWRVVELPPGLQRVTFTYTPPGWGAGWLAFGVTAPIWAGIAALAWRRRSTVPRATER